jgi:hypothetical protein
VLATGTAFIRPLGWLAQSVVFDALGSPEGTGRGLPCLSFREKPFIFRMSADPEPEDLIRRSPDAHGAVITADADRD